MIRSIKINRVFLDNIKPQNEVEVSIMRVHNINRILALYRKVFKKDVTVITNGKYVNGHITLVTLGIRTVNYFEPALFANIVISPEGEISIRHGREQPSTYILL